MEITWCLSLTEGNNLTEADLKSVPYLQSVADR